MIDAYMHLDLAQGAPLEAWEACWAEAGMTHALLVESWGGDDRCLMERLPFRPGLGRALCLRRQDTRELEAMLDRPDFLALRVREEDLARPDLPLRRMADQGVALLVSAAAGTRSLAAGLEALRRKARGLTFYVPHLGWPSMQTKEDAEWRAAMTRVAELGPVVVGLSAISHFSRQPYPHDDVRGRAQWLCSLFGPGRITVATDYPHMPQEHYTDYLALVCGWAREVFGSAWHPLPLRRNRTAEAC